LTPLHLQTVSIAQHYLHPGQLHASREACAISTVLGSCVAVCLHDPLSGVGGANHFLLPHAASSGPGCTRYALGATRELIAKTLRLGAQTSSMVAKIVGGADVLGVFRGTTDHLGIQNVRAARAILEHAGIAIDSEQVGGTRGRRLVFSTRDGYAWVKTL
jgi:chemotaxis protein CheD